MFTTGNIQSIRREIFTILVGFKTSDNCQFESNHVQLLQKSSFRNVNSRFITLFVKKYIFLRHDKQSQPSALFSGRNLATIKKARPNDKLQ